jgi:DNA-binding NarL/FixJ family response regulator
MDVDARTVRRVVIVDDSRTSQAILEAAFGSRPGFQIVGIAADAASGLDLVKRLAPDLVTLDLCMPYIDGAAFLEMLSGMKGLCKIVVSEQATKNITMASKLEALGASLCLSKRELSENHSAFLKKVSHACDQVAEASRQRIANAGLRPDRPRTAGPRPMPLSSSVRFGFPIPLDEKARLVALQRKRLANAVRERQFDLITRHAAEVTGFPVCLLTFIDENTQWVKSCFGYEAESGPRADAFCNHTIASGSLFVVQDARADQRFSSNPFVIGEPGFRTYAGQPIVSEEGTRLGAVCVLDTKVRLVTPLVTRQLATISDILGSMIDNRPALAA